MPAVTTSTPPFGSGALSMLVST
jgi:hypothetical protein